MFIYRFDTSTYCIESVTQSCIVRVTEKAPATKAEEALHCLRESLKTLTSDGGITRKSYHLDNLLPLGAEEGEGDDSSGDSNVPLRGGFADGDAADIFAKQNALIAQQQSLLKKMQQSFDEERSNGSSSDGSALIIRQQTELLARQQAILDQRKENCKREEEALRAKEIRLTEWEEALLQQQKDEDEDAKRKRSLFLSPPPANTEEMV